MTYEVLRRLVQLMPDDEFEFLFDRKFDPSYIFQSNVSGKTISPPTRHPVLMHTWLQWGVKRYLNRRKPDLFLSFDGFLPLGAKVPGVVTIHDLAYAHFPEQNRWADRWYYQNYTPRFAHEAKHIITVSHFSKSDICTRFNLGEDRVSVIYNGVDAAFKPIPHSLKEKTRQRYSNGADYFLYVGAIHPRKNIDRLIKSFDLFKRNTGSQTQLLITGRKGWLTKSVDDAYQHAKHQSDIQFTGYVADDDLPALIGASKSLCYISLFEGFGLPIIEGMASSVPVLCSNRNAMKEIAGDSALVVNPESIKEIASGMTQLDQNDDLRQNLIEHGKQRAKMFHWDHSAQQYMELLKQIHGSIE